MDIRQELRRRPKAALLVAACLLLVSVSIGLLAVDRGEPRAASLGGQKAWYTVDDGRNWFADDVNKIVPFDKDGKPAYRCYVWTCDGGQTKFVSAVERISAAGRAALRGKTQYRPLDLPPGALQLKPPLTGDKGWIDSDAPQARPLTNPICREDPRKTPEPVKAE